MKRVKQMKPIVLDYSKGSWFDMETTRKIAEWKCKEGDDYMGSWTHQVLLITEDETLILQSGVLNYPKHSKDYRVIDEKAAVVWCIGYLEEIPEELKDEAERLEV